MFRSATFKLTLWYLALVMAISLAFSVVLYHAASAEIANGLYRETQRIYSQFPVFDNSPMLRRDADQSYSIHRLLIRLITFNVIVLFGAGIASYWLARRTLMPIEEAHEQQKRFTADVSHELRTPLTALKMESEVALMNKNAGAEELRHTIESTIEEANKLENLINNLLHLSRLEVDEMQQAFSQIKLSSIIETAIHTVQNSSKERNIQITSSVKEATVYGDEASLTQLIIILLDNAVKYSSPGGEVHVTVTAVKHTATISIIDNGAGIAPESLDRVFDRFYRAEDSRSKNHTEGYGLGLSIAKMIADVHKANIILKSQLGKGTTAKIIIPLDESNKLNT